MIGIDALSVNVPEWWQYTCTVEDGLPRGRAAVSAPCCWVQYRGAAIAGWRPWLCFPLYCSGWSPGWDAWLGLGFLREEWVALFWGGYVRSPGFGEVMIWPAGISGGVLWGLVVQIWSQLPFMPRQSLVLVILVLAYL